MGASSSKPQKHSKRVKPSSITKVSSPQPNIAAKIIEALRAASIDSKSLEDLVQIEQSQSLRRLSDKTVRIELDKIAKKNGLNICIEDGQVTLLKGNRSLSR